MNNSISTTASVDQLALETKVKDMYRKVALHPERTYHFEMGRSLAERLGYPAASLDDIPEAAIASFAGVGYFFDLADLRMGECVVDLGSGSGMDVFYAANSVGPSGEVIGIDMTLAQLEKASALSTRFEYEQIHFRESYVEELPIASNSLDAVISNGVINLSSDKPKVFREAARVLKKGGRMAIADIVTTTPLPKEISCNADLWAACIGGAITQRRYLDLIEEAGLKISVVKDNPYAFLSEGAQGATRTYGIKSISLVAVKK